MFTLTAAQMSNLAEFLTELNELSQKHGIWLAEYERTSARVDEHGKVIIQITRQAHHTDPTRPEYAYYFPED